jgi:hypothetical protein
MVALASRELDRVVNRKRVQRVIRHHWHLDMTASGSPTRVLTTVDLKPWPS